MKSAKEWAESVVSSVVPVGKGWGVNLGTSDGEYVCFQRQVFEQEADTLSVDARGIIERLVERVQADALESLRDVRAELLRLQQSANPGSTAEDVCERLLPLIEEALR